MIVARKLERARLQRGKQLTLPPVVRCWNDALDLVLRADKSLAVAAGLLGRLAYTQLDWQDVIDSRVTRWFNEYFKLPTPSNKTAIQRLDPRRKALREVGVLLATQRVVEWKALAKSLKWGLRDRARRRGESMREWDREFDPDGLPAELWNLVNEAPNIEKHLMVEEDARFSCGSHAVRDAGSQAKDRSRGPIVHLDEPLREEGGQTLRDFLPDLGAPDVVSLAAREEASEAIEAYRAAELERARPGSARRAVLENLHDLLDGEVHMQDIAAAAGLGAPALCEARAAVIAEMRRLPAVRCHDPHS
jgi:hypothetical protein